MNGKNVPRSVIAADKEGSRCGHLLTIIRRSPAPKPAKIRTAKLQAVAPCVADGVGQLALGADQGKAGSEQPEQRIDDRLALLLPHSATGFGMQIPSRPTYGRTRYQSGLATCPRTLPTLLTTEQRWLVPTVPQVALVRRLSHCCQSFSTIVGAFSAHLSAQLAMRMVVAFTLCCAYFAGANASVHLDAQHLNVLASPPHHQT